MKTLLNLIIISLFLFMAFSCNTTGPEDNNGNNGTDTTSHNFIWQKFEFGEHSSSLLYDVAIIDENNIWAVGEIYMNDSLGQPDPHPYGLIHWNGSEWKPKRITAQNPSGGLSYISPTGIFVINTSEIWLAHGGVFLFDGQSITRAFWLINYSGYSGGIFNNGETAQKLYRTESNNLYTVGNKGAVAVYNGTKWQKIESGTDLDIYAIAGKDNSETTLEIYAIAAKHLVNTNKKIIKINNSSIEELSTVGIPSSIRSIWFKPGKKYYVVGNGIYSKTDISSDQPWESLPRGITQYYLYSIDGQDLNDIAVCGSYGELIHYNGSSWKSYQNELNLDVGAYFEIKFKDNLIIAVGYDSPKAVIAVGKR